MKNNRHLLLTVASTFVLCLTTLESLRADTYTWGFDAGGNWDDSTAATGWNADGAFPNASGDVANLTFDITAPRTVTINVANATVGSLNINDSGASADSGWTIAGANPLTFAVSSGNAALNSGGAANLISAPIVLNNTLDATIGIDTNFSGAISGSGGLNKLGTGILTMSGAGANTYTGLTTVGSGTLTLAKGDAVTSIAGNITIETGGTLMQGGSNQIADGATVTINAGGIWNFSTSARSETIANLTVNGGSFTAPTTGSNGSSLTVSGTTTVNGGTISSSTGNPRTLRFGHLNLSNGGSVVATATSESGGSTWTATNVTISNVASGAYTAMTFRERGTRFTQFNVSGNFVFNGTANTNSVLIADTMQAGATGINSINLTTGNHDFTIHDGAAASDLVIEPRLAGAGASIEKKGAGTLELKDANTYTGSTTVSAGTLLISGAGSINTTAGISLSGGALRYTSSVALDRMVNVSGGSFQYNSSANFAGILNFTSGTVGGNNLNGVSLTGANAVGAGKVISPGNSPGTLQVDDVTFENGGSYLWEINDLAGTQGGNPGWDWIYGNLDTLDLNSLTAGGFVLQIDSLGALSGWNPSGSYSWTIASFGLIDGFAAGDFVLNTSAFSDQNSIAGGAFTLTSDGTSLFLNYAPVPEPSAAALVAIGVAGCLALRRRRS